MFSEVEPQNSNLIGVYLITTPSKRNYVGMTCDSFSNRFKGHLKSLRRGKHSCRPLLHSYNKYGWDSFNLTILETWEKPSSREELDSLQKVISLKEKYWWEQLYCDGAVMLNGCPNGTGSVLHSEDSKKLIRETRRKAYENNPRFSFSEKEIKLIQKDFENGVSIKNISLKYDKSLRALSRFIKQNSFERKFKKASTRSFDKLKEQHPEILFLHFEEGLSAVEISSLLGYSSSYISSFLREEKKINPSLDSSKAIVRNVDKISKALRLLPKEFCFHCGRSFGKTVIASHVRSCEK